MFDRVGCVGLRSGLGLMFVIGAGSALAQPDSIIESDKKELQEIAGVRRAMALDVYRDARHPQPEQPDGVSPVIYGEDDRLDVYEVSDAQLLGIQQAAVLVVDISEISDNGDGTYTLNTGRFTDACPEEPFGNQMRAGFCSGFLVGTDLIVTAGHCTSPGEVGSTAFVFGFDQQGPGTGPGADPETVIPASNVYFGAQSVDFALGGGLDHSVVRVDRPVVGRTPLPVRRDADPVQGDPLVMVGHPHVIPKKIAGGAVVGDPLPGQGFFTSNLDAYGGNSGSMVVNLNDNTIEGILVRGNPDWNFVGGCRVSNVCDDSGCSFAGDWEEVSKTRSFASSIPPLGLQFGPAGEIRHVGRVGGPFTNSAFDITVDNTTAEPLNFEIVQSTGFDTHALFFDGQSGPATGTVQPGGQVVIAAQLAEPGFQPAGITENLITMTDLGNGRTTELVSVLEVGQTGISVSPLDDFFGSGPVGGPITGERQYVVTSTRPEPVTVEVSGEEPWIAIDGTPGAKIYQLASEGDSAVVTVSASSLADGLSAGVYDSLVTFDNLGGPLGDASVGASLDVGRFVIPAADTPIAISDNSSFESVVTVDQAFCVGDVDVSLDISHSFIGDLRVVLTSPDGTSVTLHDRSGGSADDLMVTYDDEAGQPADGPGSLSDFDFGASAGDWVLSVSDNAGGDTGALNGWQLRIASSGDDCPPQAFDVSAVGGTGQMIEVWLSGSSATGSDLSYSVASLPGGGSLMDVDGQAIASVPFELAGDSVFYTSSDSFTGVDTFTYTVSDGSASSAEATASVDVGAPIVAAFTFDTDPGWSRDGQWEFGVPQGQTDDPSSAYSGQNVFGYNLSGDYTNNMPERYLTTGEIDLAGVTGATVEFQRWLAMESSTFDDAAFQYQIQDGPWVDLWRHDGGTFQDGAWVEQSFDISDADGALVSFRWVMGATDGSVTYGGWNIDDFVVRGITEGSDCLADVNGDGELTGADFNSWLGAFNAMEPAGDQNQDGQFTGADFNSFLGNFNDGCP